MNNKTIEQIYGDGEVNHSIIWLHGLGAGADDFVPVVPGLGLNKERSIRFVFPQAPNRPITINGGMVMPGWYDIKGMDLADKEDLNGFHESQEFIESLIDQQLALGVPSENILLVGFSQGGAVAYYVGLRSKRKLAGIIALSTYVPFADKTEHERSAVNQSIPILSMHGTLDPVVPMSLGEDSVEALKKLSYQPAWRTYIMEHSVVPEQIGDIGNWINLTYDRGDSVMSK